MFVKVSKPDLDHLKKQQIHWLNHQIFAKIKIQNLTLFLALYPQNACASCQKVRSNLSICSNCNDAKYCNSVCQSKDWPKHSRFCLSQSFLDFSWPSYWNMPKPWRPCREKVFEKHTNYATCCTRVYRFFADKGLVKSWFFLFEMDFEGRKIDLSNLDFSLWKFMCQVGSFYFLVLYILAIHRRQSEK